MRPAEQRLRDPRLSVDSRARAASEMLPRRDTTLTDVLRAAPGAMAEGRANYVQQLRRGQFPDMARDFPGDITGLNALSRSANAFAVGDTQGGAGEGLVGLGTMAAQGLFPRRPPPAVPGRSGPLQAAPEAAPQGGRFTWENDTFHLDRPEGQIRGRLWRNSMNDQNALKVDSSATMPEFRGRGFGTQLYEQAAQEAARRGLPLVSDYRVSLDAARVYDSLARRGYALERNPFAELQGQNWVSRDGQPVFTLRPPEAAPEAAPRPPTPPPRELGRASDGSVMPVAPARPFRNSLRGGSGDLRDAASFGQ